MSVARTIRKVWRANPTREGAGVHLKRAFGYQEVPQFDPFLLLDDFRSDDPSKYLPGFPWYPHRGIETITYMSEVTVSTEETPVRFPLASGNPIGERVAWYGPIVMNTREELRIAFEEYAAGTFIKQR